jgi:CDP-diacylglycerol--glycerol-3-phosphate 3-phosphatidyltransferase
MAGPDSTRFWNVPNALSVGRLALSVVLFALIARGWYVAALVVFVVAAISDALDGYLARRLNQATDIGRQLDPLVDKVMVAGAFIYFATIEGTGVAPWMVTAIVVRELLIQGVRSLIEGRGEPFGANLAGKLKTTFQCLAIVAVLLALIARPSPGWLIARDVITWTSVILTIYSGVGYLALAWPMLRGASPPLRAGEVAGGARD